MRITISLAVICVSIVIDQVTKSYALIYFAEESVSILPILNFVLVYNTGVSFGMFNTLPTPMILAGLSLFVTFILAIWLFRERRMDLSIALAFIIGGAIGNVIDRIRVGAVIDFLDFHYADMHYPAFNIADSCIVLGIAFLLIDGLFLEPKRNASNNEIETNENA